MKTAKILVGLSVIICVNLYVLAKNSWRELTVDPWLTYSQMSALVGTILLSWTYILSSRLPFLEEVLGPFDRLYKLHHKLGTWAFVLIATHPLGLVLRSWNNSQQVVGYLWPVNNWVWLVGWISLQAMVVLLFLTLVVRLPYHIWKWSHRLLGISLMSATIHIFYISSDVARYWPLRVWVLGWLTLSILTWIYLKMIYPKFGKRYEYKISQIKPEGDIVEITLEAKDKIMQYEGGQFAFFRFEDKAVGNEEHPFSIAGGDGKKLILAIKMGGDYTKNMAVLQAGTKVVVRGPYGSLGRNFGDPEGVVLIGGGIGVTPMMGMADAESREPKNRPIDFVYAVKSINDAYGVERIKKYQGKNFKLHIWESNTKGRIGSKDIIGLTNNFGQKRYIICGPREMMKELKEGLLAAGIRSEKVEYEDFALK